MTDAEKAQAVYDQAIKDRDDAYKVYLRAMVHLSISYKRLADASRSVAPKEEKS